MELKGDLLVRRTIKADRRVNSGATAETITATLNLVADDYQWIRCNNSSSQNVVLPNATTLPMGWNVVIDVPDTSNGVINVQTYHEVTPVELKVVIIGRAYRFTCVNNNTAVGTWHIDFLEEADLIPTERYITTFDATSSWGVSQTGYYTISVEEDTHGRGVTPNVIVRELSGSVYINVNPDLIKTTTTGTVSIRVPSTPDLRFAGQIIFI